MIKEVKEGTVITGASDDLIEVRGELYDEFNSFLCEKGIVSFSDGTLLRVKYDDDGIWRFETIFKGALFKERIEGEIEEDTNDEVYFHSGLKWCVFSDEMQVTFNKKKVRRC